MKHPFLYIAALAGMLLQALPSNAADLAQGKLKVQQVCQTCHGVGGMAPMAGVPNLGGQKEEYLIAQLRAFRASRRQHAQMSIIAQGLSDADIENVAKWYSSIRISIELPDIE